MLLTPASAHTAQTLAHIKLENIQEAREGFEIKIPDLIKTSRWHWRRMDSENSRVNCQIYEERSY